jgi:hypothetical protein
VVLRRLGRQAAVDEAQQGVAVLLDQVDLDGRALGSDAIRPSSQP